MQVTHPNLKWQPQVAYKKSQCKRYLLIVTLYKNWRFKCTTPVYMHHVSVKKLSNLLIRYSARLTEEEERWTKCVGGNIQNTDFKHDFDKVKGCIMHRCPCTTHLDSLNCGILRHKKGIWWNTYHCLYRHHFGPRQAWQLILKSLQASLHTHTQIRYASRCETLIQRK